MISRHAPQICARRILLIAALLCVGLSGAGTSASATTYYPDNPQIGTASTDSTDTYATGVEAFLGHYPTPQSIPDIDNTALAWWVGVDLADGTFLQAGLVTGSGWGCDSNYGVFVYVIRPDNSNPVHWGGQTDGTCGTYITTYGQFLIQSFLVQDEGGYQLVDWKFSTPFNGYGNGQVFETISSTTGSHKPGVVMELTTLTGTADLADQMGPAGAYPATLTQHGYGNPYADTLAAAAYVNHTTDCPPSTVAGEDQGYNPGYPNRAGVGSQAYFGYPCVSNGTPLWP